MPQLILLFLSIAATLGLWVLLFRTPVIRHLFWFFSRRGRRSGDPAWTVIDFENFLMSRTAWWGAALDKLMTCRGCQSLHCAWVAAVIAALQGIRVSPEIWALGLLSLVALFYLLTGILSKE